MLKKFSDHRLITAFFAAALLFIIGGFAWAFFTLRAVGQSAIDGGSLILHFNDVNGITSVGGLGTIVFMGLFGILVTLMNCAIALEFETRGPFLGKFFASMTLLFAILLFIAFAAIINVNV